VVNSRTQSLDGKSPQQLYDNYLLCAEHFEPSQFMNSATRSSLIHCAVPTIFNVPNPPKGLALKRSKLSDRPHVPDKKPRSQTTSEQSAAATGVIQTSSTTASDISQTPRKAELASKLTYSRRCLARARASLFRTRSTAEPRMHAELRCSGWCSKIGKLSVAVQQFVSSQVHAASVSPLGVRWTQQDKLLALGLYYKSPSAYRFMRRAFCFPTVRTLRTFLSGFSVTVGFDCDYMLALRKRVESMNEQKFVVVTFDGMSLRSSLKYLEHDDRIVGFEDLNSFGGSSTDAAKQALQFMVRGISTRWKQPVGHFFTGTSVNADVLKAMVLTLLTKLEAIGLRVAAIVCDQETNHRICLAGLGATAAKPKFTTENGNDVYVMYDPPHLMKNVRNNMLRYDIIIGSDVISFDYISKLFDLEQASVLRFVPKLTKTHIEPNAFKRMNVKLATQVLSHSVASAIRAYIALEKLPTDANATADFVERVNRLFDIMNSNKRKTNNKWKRPLTLKSVEQMNELKSFTNWASQWRFKSKQKSTIVKQTLPFKDGLMMTCTALHDVCMSLLETNKFRFVLTSRFNQDIVENWFSCIRGKGRNNDSRTTLEFESASKNIAINWMLECPHKGANCEPDFDSFVGLINATQQQRQRVAADASVAQCSTSAEGDIGSVDLPNISDASADRDLDKTDISADWCQLFALTDVDQNVLCYIAGYICAKLNRRLSCQACLASYVASKQKHQSSTALHTALTKARNFDWAKYGLTIPTPDLFDLCCGMERAVQMNIERVMAGPRVMRCLKDIINETVDVRSYQIDVCCDKHRQYWLNTAVTLFLRVRIHHFVKIRNRELKDLADKKKAAKATVSKPSRKLKKVKHV